MSFTAFKCLAKARRHYNSGAVRARKCKYEDHLCITLQNDLPRKILRANDTKILIFTRKDQCNMKYPTAMYNPHMTPNSAIEEFFRLTPVQKTALKRLRIHTLHDLFYHFPVRYESASTSSAVANLTHGSKVTLYGTFTKLDAKKLWKSRRPATEGQFEDSTGRVKVLWFNQPYMNKYLKTGQLVKVSGTVAGKDKPYITNPEVESVARSAIPMDVFESGATGNAEAMFPVYPETRGVTSRWFYHALKKIFGQGVHVQLEDPIPSGVREKLHLPTLASALVYLHTPKNERDASAARKRFAFEEIFVIQSAKQKERADNDAQKSLSVSVDKDKTQQFIETLPYELTEAQKRAVDEIFSDFQANRPMARLLEGDVGSGKTAVAAATAYAVVTSRPPGRTSGTLQVAYMAPTEILASQHFSSFIEHFKELPINIGLLTGSSCFKFPSKIARDKPTKISRSQLLKWVESGEIAMLIGTHALIQKTVAFQNLAYVIVDEQHRFGTAQRRALAQKNMGSMLKSDAIRGTGSVRDETYTHTAKSERGTRNEEVRRFQRTVVPHFLSMTATPIPRTLALTIYGDLDISVLDEMPTGRVQVETRLIRPSERQEAYTAVREQLMAGRQAYVICPRIEEADPEKANALRVKSARAEAEHLQRDIFPEYTVGLLHGKLRPKEKDEVMEQFSSGAIHILVATSVVEVGINVANATIILIEGAERFGLSQLHQLRGRVQRSHYQPYCFLLPDTKSAQSLTRLRALAQTANGFELAEKDLELRGAGDLYGRAQWGVSDLGMEALKNPRLIEAARKEAHTLIAADPTLLHHRALAQRIQEVGNTLHSE